MGAVTADTKPAEKAYLARTGSSTWERFKPFSQPGADTMAESAKMLHDFAVAMLMLQPAPTDLILDLGAGGCWCSDLLGRLNRRAVAVDISLDMLRAGRSRPTGDSIRAVTGDLERLPFRSGTFTKAVCLSAIHHVPDIPAALRELSRVLTDDGMVLFSEPGLGHATSPGSAAAMRDFGVLEQDIVIADFARASREAGFRHVLIKPLAYAVPAVELTPEEFDHWSRHSSSKRPRRALEKMGRAFLELLGLGKKTMLFEEAFAMSVVRTLHHAMEDHPLILLSKRPMRDPSAQGTWSARIEAQVADHARRGVTIPVTVTVTNAGSAVWPHASPSGIGQVMVGVQLLDADARLTQRDYRSAPLPRDVKPGESATVTIECPVPVAAGLYHLKFDCVSSGVTWFEAVGSPTVTTRLRVD
jgi:ubiquinone/menaquinone biosynthesis C-methylase UbiE